MQVGMVGLGRMGSNMVRRLLGAGHECVAFDVHPPASGDVVKAGATATRSLAELVSKLETPRAIWIMVPAAVVESTVGELASLLTKGDTIIDGGNSYYAEGLNILRHANAGNAERTTDAETAPLRRLDALVDPMLEQQALAANPLRALRA
ncbi:MAG TPA: NAD(P)-binding domain-containing protein [Polyangiaceae bacterium]|nr:NAD(P)-binding domain-containing protein [Polyangiaceae bacterium]